MARWKSCIDHKPDTERQVLVARPDRIEVEAAQYLCPEEAWVEAGTDAQIWPSVWREMPPSPFSGD
jgi:hypothetical protein